jgi:hypothetical protein
MVDRIQKSAETFKSIRLQECLFAKTSFEEQGPSDQKYKYFGKE